MRISLIAAASENNVIGSHGKIPWSLPNDLKHFRRVTEGHPVIMGRKTYESIGRPLPKRRNIVITRQENFSAPGCDVVASLDEALELAKKDAVDEVFVIGGGEIYKEALSKADRIFVTRVHTNVFGDAFFIEFHPEHWTETSHERHEPDAEHAVPYTFLVYEKKL